MLENMSPLRNLNIEYRMKLTMVGRDRFGTDACVRYHCLRRPRLLFLFTRPSIERFKLKYGPGFSTLSNLLFVLAARRKTGLRCSCEISGDGETVQFWSLCSAGSSRRWNVRVLYFYAILDIQRRHKTNACKRVRCGMSGDCNCRFYFANNKSRSPTAFTAIRQIRL